MTRPRTTASKHNVQQHKREKAQAKQQRRAARRLAEPEASTPPIEASEAELVADLASIHSAVESGAISIDEFEQRLEHIREQLELLVRRQ